MHQTLPSVNPSPGFPNPSNRASAKRNVSYFVLESSAWLAAILNLRRVHLDPCHADRFQSSQQAPPVHLIDAASVPVLVIRRVMTRQYLDLLRRAVFAPEPD